MSSIQCQSQYIRQVLILSIAQHMGALKGNKQSKQQQLHTQHRTAHSLYNFHFISYYILSSHLLFLLNNLEGPVVAVSTVLLISPVYSVLLHRTASIWLYHVQYTRVCTRSPKKSGICRSVGVCESDYRPGTYWTWTWISTKDLFFSFLPMML